MARQVEGIDAVAQGGKGVDVAQPAIGTAARAMDQLASPDRPASITRVSMLAMRSGYEIIAFFLDGDAVYSINE